MIGEYDDCIDCEWMAIAHVLEGVAQQDDVFGEQVLTTVSQIYCEKEAATGKKVASIVGHRHSIADEPTERRWVSLPLNPSYGLLGPR